MTVSMILLLFIFLRFSAVGRILVAFIKNQWFCVFLCFHCFSAFFYVFLWSSEVFFDFFVFKAFFKLLRNPFGSGWSVAVLVRFPP